MPDEKGTPNAALPPDTTTETAPEVKPKPEVKAAEGAETEAASERQSTREWLRSLGIVAGDVATREAPRMEREVEAERPQPRREERTRTGRDTDEVLNLLREGDDERFIEGVVDLSRKRIMDDMSKTEREAAFGAEINKFVTHNAPDVPLVVFWSFAERAERMYPGSVDKQIDWAIEAGRAAMELHNSQQEERGRAIRTTQEQSETLDGAPTRPRRRGAREPEGKTTTFVEELLAARSKYE